MATPTIQASGSPPAAFLVNVNSRRGREARDEAVAALEAAGLSVAPRDVRSEEEAAEALRAEVARGAPFVVVGGGDGTLSSAAGVLAGTDTALAALPMGTGNTFARSLGLPLDLAEAARALAGGRVERADAGRVNGQVFLNSVTLGLSGSIADALDHETKRRLGLLAWPVVGARILLTRRPMRLRITATDRTFVLRTRQLVVANGKYVAGPLAASPAASLENGVLEVFALGGASLGSLARGALRWLLGRHREAPEARYFQTRRLRVESLGRPVPADVDGEIRGTTPLSIEAVPGALPVVVPNS
jgi:YegS/Rv2252/BmrU family lipid kinase